MYLDTNLDFLEHLNKVLSKVKKITEAIRKLQAFLPHQSLVTVYWAFIRPNIDYRNIIYDPSYNACFHQKIGSIQYNAALAITVAIRGAAREKL